MQTPQTFAQNSPSPATVKKQTTRPSAKQLTDDQQFEQRKISEVHLWTCENQVSLKTAQSEKGLMLLWNKKLYQFSEVDALTGATKFIDLKKGGFAIYNNNLLEYKVFNKKKFEIFYKKKYFIKPETIKFNKINYNKYFKLIFKIRNKRLVHSIKINKIYKKLKAFKSVREIKGDWRYSFEVLSKKKFYNIKKIEFSKLIFFGYNYPDILRLKKNHKFFVNKKYSPRKNIINLFNDFRYDSFKAKKTYQAIIKQL